MTSDSYDNRIVATAYSLHCEEQIAWLGKDILDVEVFVGWEFGNCIYMEESGSSMA